ncbi:TPA: undecaprenyl-diphosphatase UppP [Candidatus Falkowbacteria bacterium]|nr:undecaprenyl-diphosphatase UppP [Candidatus Falkowbacteria bacterium]
MIIIYATFFALVQAVTEFWPVSSSGHLVLLHELLQMQVIDDLTFDVALHLGTALALIWYFWVDIKRYAKAFFSIFRGVNLGSEDQKTVFNLMLATVPAVLVGIFLESTIEVVFRSVIIVAINLIVGGLIIFAVERWGQKKRDFENLSLIESFGIGCAQALALIPGVSRSGSTIITGMILKLKRPEAARFSFLLSIPIVLGAAAKKLFEISWNLVSAKELYIFLYSVILTFVIGYFIIKYFLRFLQNRSLNIFGWYRILLGLIILAVYYL